jgi:uncharacterized membrane protein HdeD (DUF308 family)
MNESTDNQNSGLNIFFGILLIILGFIALSSQFITTLLSTYFFGWILLIGGIVQFFYGFFSGGWGKAVLSFIGGILSFIVGLIVVINPLLSATLLTFMIAFLFLILGTYKMLSSAISQNPQWGWTFFGGAISLLLGISMLAGWPASGLWIIGLFIGIELIITGFLLMTNRMDNAYDTTPQQSSYMAGAKGGRTKKDDKSTR